MVVSCATSRLRGPTAAEGSVGNLRGVGFAAPEMCISGHDDAQVAPYVAFCEHAFLVSFASGTLDGWGEPWRAIINLWMSLSCSEW